jgi:photosystem II stability/assembly factor-like uncharacterized protein
MKRLTYTIIILLSLTYSNSNAQWQHSNSTVGSYVYRITANETGVFAGLNTTYYNAEVILSTDSGNSWNSASSGLPSREIDAIAAFGNNLYVGLNDAGIYISTDNGSSWAVTSVGVAYCNGFASIGSKVFASDANNGVSYTTDKGATWTVINNGLTTTATRTIFANGSNLFLGTYAKGVFLSTDEGANWTQTSKGLPAGYQYVYSFAVIGSNIFCGTYNRGVYISTNNGTNWTSANSGLPNYPVYSLATSGTNLFAGSDGGGVYLSTDNGASWTSVSSDLMDLGVHTLIINGGNLFAGCDTSGIWCRPLSQMITAVDDNESNLPNIFSLSQNYPNPFNPSTVIKYSLPAESFVTIKLYDLLGREIKTLVNEDKTAGSYSYTFNASDLSSGIYFYRMEAGNFTQSHKLVLLK